MEIQKESTKKHPSDTAKQVSLKRFGENLTAIMSSKHITQKELANTVGVAASTLSAYRNGTKSPTLPVAIEIAKACNVSLDWLCNMGNFQSSESSDNYAYSDVIRLLTDLSRITPINVTPIGNAYNVCPDSRICIYTNDNILDHFLDEWSQVKALFDKGTIGKNVYDPWIAQQLKDYDCSIDEIPDTLKEQFTQESATAQNSYSEYDDDGEIPF